MDCLKIKNIISEDYYRFGNKKVHRILAEFQDGKVHEDYFDGNKKHTMGCRLGLEGHPVLWSHGVVDCSCKFRYTICYDAKLLMKYRDEMRELQNNPDPSKLNEIYKKLAPGTTYISVVDRIANKPV